MVNLELQSYFTSFKQDLIKTFKCSWRKSCRSMEIIEILNFVAIIFFNFETNKTFVNYLWPINHTFFLKLKFTWCCNCYSMHISMFMLVNYLKMFVGQLRARSFLSGDQSICFVPIKKYNIRRKESDWQGFFVPENRCRTCFCDLLRWFESKKIL